MFNGLIYKYTSPSGKVYIGQTIQEKRRKVAHKNNAKNGVQGYFYNAIRKYGFENFSYDVLIRIQSEDRHKVFTLLDALERHYIKLYDSRNPNKGYNITEGGEGSKGFHHTEEHKQYLRENFHKSKLNSDEVKEKTKKINIVRCSKHCYQYSKCGVLINEFPSVAEASRQTGINNIQAVCKGNRVTAGGYIWSYYKKE